MGSLGALGGPWEMSSAATVLSAALGAQSPTCWSRTSLRLCSSTANRATLLWGVLIFSQACLEPAVSQKTEDVGAKEVGGAPQAGCLEEEVAWKPQAPRS